MSRNTHTKKTTSPVVSLKALCLRHNLIGPDATHLKYADCELLAIADNYISRLESRLQDAKKVYREQQTTIGKLSQTQLWRFDKTNVAPPQFREEYMRKLQEKSVDKKIVLVRDARE